MTSPTHFPLLLQYVVSIPTHPFRTAGSPLLVDSLTMHGISHSQAEYRHHHHHHHHPIIIMTIITIFIIIIIFRYLLEWTNGDLSSNPAAYVVSKAIGGWRSTSSVHHLCILYSSSIHPLFILYSSPLEAGGPSSSILHLLIIVYKHLASFVVCSFIATGG
jgi:hypothetical protein